MSDKDRITDTEYIYITAMIRSLEALMLTSDRIAQMLEVGNANEVAVMLLENGYEDMSGMTARQVEKSLAEQKEKRIRDVENVVPEKQLVKAFRLKYDYHNAKSLVKAQGAGVDGSHLLVDTGRYPAQQIQSMFEEDDYVFATPTFGNAVKEAREVLAKTGNPQLSDHVLDVAYFEEMLSMAEHLSDKDFFVGYVKTLIDSVNLRTAVRVVRMGRDVEYMQMMMVPGGSHDTKLIAESAGMGDNLAGVFVGTPLDGAGKQGAAVMRGGLMTVFERCCDNSVMRYLYRAKCAGFGNAHVIAYLSALETEITNVRIIMTGLLAGIDPTEIRERLRDPYA